MAGMICPSCGHANADGDTLCSICGYLVAEDSGGPEPVALRKVTPPAPPARPAAGPAEHAVPSGQAPDTCPACGAVIPDPGNLVCVDCLEPLARRRPPAPPVHTRREDGPGSLRLVFGGQPVEVPRPGTLLLGRDPGQSTAAATFAARDNVSRRHASVGVESDGSAWVRDEHSANGTFVNDTPVPAGRTRALAHGDRLRLASDVVARVELG